MDGPTYAPKKSAGIQFPPFSLDTLPMPYLFELVIIAFLLLISVELLLIHRELMRSQVREKQAKEDAPAAGQTINVTVGGSSGAPATVVVAHEKEPPAPPIEAAPVPPEPEKPSPPPTAARVTSSGLVAKKCAACGAENSSFRSECFNCGLPL